MAAHKKVHGRFKVIMVKDEGRDCKRLTRGDLEKLPALKEALKAARDSYLDITSRYPAQCYELFLQPSSVELSRDDVEGFKTLLSVSEVPFRRGSVIVEWNGRRYKVWLDLQLCG